MARPLQKILQSPKPVLLQSSPHSHEQFQQETEETIRPEQSLFTRAIVHNKPLAGAQRLAVIENAAHFYGNQRVQSLLASYRTPLLQRAPVADPVQTEPKIKHPEKFTTYEQWLGQFGDFAATHTFTSRDTGEKDLKVSTGHKVLGDPDPNNKAAPYDDKTAPEDKRPAAPVNPVQGDHFIDHPTNNWLQANLPQELIYCAYQLPADCADIAVILRHVWLFYHNRTEKYGSIVIGVGAGKTDKARHQKVHQDITDIYSGNVATMVNAYSDAGGNPIRSFKVLQNLLHPGDILVWEHHNQTKSGFSRSGGHTHTITNIERKDGKITKISCLQGNQPIGRTEAEIIREKYGLPAFKGKGKDPLRTAPGRRIEVGELNPDRLNDDTGSGPEAGVWWWSDAYDGGFTNLVVAGSPASATGVTSKKGKKGTKGILGRPNNWLPILNKASRETLQGTFEAALQAARAVIEGGETLPEEEARQVGEAAGARLFKLDEQKPVLDKAVHLARISEIEAVLDALANAAVAPATQGKVKNIFAIIKDSFHKTALRNETRVGNTRRIPLEGLAQGPRPAGQNRAIVIIPPAVKIPASPSDWNVEVLLHFHGRNAQLDKGNASHDVAADKLEQQLEATGRALIGVLPVGTADAKFGADFESNSYIDQVFLNLSASGVWPKAPSIKQVVVSAHSGGGLALTQGEKPKDKGIPEHGMLGTARAPSAANGKKLGEVVLFDAINGPDEYRALLSWLDQQLSAELNQLIGLPNDAKKNAFLQTSLRFKAYHTGEEGAKPAISLKASYASRHQQLRIDLAKWFSDHTAQALASGVNASIFANLKNNYQVIATGKGEHDNMMGRGHVKDALN